LAQLEGEQILKKNEQTTEQMNKRKKERLNE